MIDVETPVRTYSLTWRTLASLFAGRVTFRVMLFLANAVPALQWQGEYAQLAAALGATVFLIPLASLGVEKGALKLAPRDPREANRIVGTMLVLSWLLVVVCLVLIGFRQWAGGGSWFLLGAGLYAVLMGHNQVLVGLSRALARNFVDFVNHGGLSLGLLGLIVLTQVAALDPLTYLWLLTALLLVANIVLVLSLGPALRQRPSARIVRGSLATTWRMAVGDLIPGLIITLVFEALLIAGRGAESSALYLAVVAASVVVGGFGYLLRVLQPQVARALAGDHWPSASRLVLRHLRRMLVWGTLGLAVCTLLATVLAGTADTRQLGVATMGLFLTSTPLMVVMGTANYILENASEEALHHTAISCLLSVLPTVALTALLIPTLGAIGAVAVLSAAELLHGLLLLPWLTQAVRGTRTPEASDPEAHWKGDTTS